MRKHLPITQTVHFLFGLLLFFSITGNDLKAQLTYRVLFLGNSYTGVNNLPQLVHDVAASAGDNLIFDSNSPGGYRLEDHSLDVTTQNKIMAGGWDYVVIQGQSQEPVMSSGKFTGGGLALCSLVIQYNSCAITMPYMTWGRKNGDASNCANFPMMCSYQSMDSVLKKRYLELTASVNGEVSPVSVVWKYLRKNHPAIDLYQADESHPSAAGSYAAACCFYTSIFKKDPTLITYNFGLSAADAAVIRNAVKTEVFNSLPAWDFKKKPVSAFTYQMGSGINQVIFSSINKGIKQTYFWNFGDGNTSTAVSPTHSYLNNGTYTVSLTTTNCDLQGTYTSYKDTIVQFCAHTPTIYATHPWLCTVDTLWTQKADAYQWYYYTQALPETKQYLANYSQYNASGFTVRSTVNGCSEMSTVYTESADWSGYYFDLLGNPCEGDTVAFAVLYKNGALSGSEKILWYKNGVLLPSMNNEDTLLIFASGEYQCKVIDPISNCPLDTTSYLIKYDCGDVVDVGIQERKQELSWTVFPNPASESITFKFTKGFARGPVQIYDATGDLIKELEAPKETSFSIADLPKGLYFIRLKSDQQRPLKFIKQ